MVTYNIYLHTYIHIHNCKCAFCTFENDAEHNQAASVAFEISMTPQVTVVKRCSKLSCESREKQDIKFQRSNSCDLSYKLCWALLLLIFHSISS